MNAIWSLLVVAWLATGEIPQPVRYVGKVKSINEDGSGFLLRTGKLQVRAKWSRTTEVILHRGVKLADLQVGVFLHVLGRRQKAAPIPESSMHLPPQIIQIVAIAAGQFEPPPLSQELKKRKLVWISSKLHKDQNTFMLGTTAMQIGKNRMVVWMKPGSRSDVKKNATVKVHGRFEELKNIKVLKVKKLQVLSPKVPKKEYQLLLGN